MGYLKEIMKVMDLEKAPTRKEVEQYDPDQIEFLKSKGVKFPETAKSEVAFFKENEMLVQTINAHVDRITMLEEQVALLIASQDKIAETMVETNREIESKTNEVVPLEKVVLKDFLSLRRRR
jgi:hypothetical protein